MMAASPPIATPPRYSIIVTCKGRLEHLLRSLPLFLAQRNAEVVVVDYSCPDHTASVLAQLHPQARVVAVEAAAQFNLSHARNLGAAAATGELLIFLDADVIIAPDFTERLDGLVAETDGCFHRFQSASAHKLGIAGSCVVARKHFEAVQGYDEALQGYGGEDADFYFRLGMVPLRSALLAEDLVAEVLQHDDASRVRFYRRQSIPEGGLINAAYRHIKNMLLKQQGVTELDSSIRRRLYGNVEQTMLTALQRSETTIRFDIELLDDPSIRPFSAWRFSRRIAVELNARQPAEDDRGPGPMRPLGPG